MRHETINRACHAIYDARFYPLHLSPERERHQALKIHLRLKSCRLTLSSGTGLKCRERQREFKRILCSFAAQHVVFVMFARFIISGAPNIPRKQLIPASSISGFQSFHWSKQFQSEDIHRNQRPKWRGGALQRCSKWASASTATSSRDPIAKQRNTLKICIAMREECSNASCVPSL
jgi:hypothetical protein